ncbi:MAG: hypothetical protein QOJ98_3605 [Acidobacteriota bacterium]|jgi:hypothetical protein|nr:hypothetical protein [Acidobacteriota bacterium]
MKTLVALLTLVAFGCGESVETRMAKELARVEASLQASEQAKLPAEMQEMPKAYRAELEKARSAKSPELRLYRLRNAAVGAELLTFFHEHRNAAGKELAPLTKLWNERRAVFDRPVASVRGPLLQRALVESSRNRADKLFRASLPYAKVSSPFAGVYYLAEAEGNRRFAEFVASLPGTKGGPSPRADRVEAALRSLEGETLVAFGSDPTAPKMIPVSAKLKEAREQLAHGFVDGAALSLLEARMRFSRGADDQLPASLIALASERQPLQAKKVLPASVTVTLVRWPYT